MKKKVPEEILALAKEELDWLKRAEFPHAGEMKYVGERDGVRYYTPYYPEAVIGYPTVYTIDSKGKCGEINGHVALKVLSSF